VLYGKYWTWLCDDVHRLGGHRNNCNMVVQAESLMMPKALYRSVWPVRYTFSIGGSAQRRAALDANAYRASMTAGRRSQLSDAWT